MNKSIIPLDQWDQFRQFFIHKTRSQPYLKNSRPMTKDFDTILSDVLDGNRRLLQKDFEEDPFSRFLIYIKKNQKF